MHLCANADLGSVALRRRGRRRTCNASNHATDHTDGATHHASDRRLRLSEPDLKADLVRSGAKDKEIQVLVDGSQIRDDHAPEIRRELVTRAKTQALADPLLQFLRHADE